MFNFIRFFGLMIAGSIGLFRIFKNNLLHHESPIYWATSITCFYMAIAFAISTSTMFTPEIRHGLVRAGWLPLVACLISLQLYYRQFDIHK